MCVCAGGGGGGLKHIFGSGPLTAGVCVFRPMNRFVGSMNQFVGSKTGSNRFQMGSFEPVSDGVIVVDGVAPVG